MKRKISAIVYTLMFLAETFIAPFFMEWYISKLKSEPIGVYFVLSLLILAQIALCIYLWVRAFNENLD